MVVVSDQNQGVLTFKNDQKYHCYISIQHVHVYVSQYISSPIDAHRDMLIYLAPRSYYILSCAVRAKLFMCCFGKVTYICLSSLFSNLTYTMINIHGWDLG